MATEKSSAQLKLEQLIEEENAKRTKERKADYKLGHRFAVIAWIHPKAGGDDYEIEYHSNLQFKDEDIKKAIRKKRSEIDTDYTQFNILEDGTLTLLFQPGPPKSAA